MIDETMPLSEGRAMKSRAELHDMSIAYIAKKNQKEEEESDQDYDFKEFDDAEVEEAEDRIYTTYKKKQNRGEVIDPDELADIAGNVPVQDMNESVVMSALAGRFEPKPKRMTRLEESNMMLDISAMMQMPERQKNARIYAATQEHVASSAAARKGQFT